MILRTTNPYPAILRRGQQNIFLTFPSQRATINTEREFKEILPKYYCCFIEHV